MANKSLPKEEVKLPKPELDLPKPQTDLPLPEEEISAVVTKPTRPFRLPLKLFAFLVLLVLFFTSGIMLLQNNAVKTTPASSPTPSPTPDPTANWTTYTHPSLPFSLKYPSDVLIPSFKNIDPQALKNRLSNISSDIDSYVESKYYGNGIDGFDDADNTGLGSLLPKSGYVPNSTFSYRGIRFSQYYLGNKDISTLAPYFRNNKGFSTIQINGVKVGVFDGTTKTTGIPPAYVKTYYFRMGEYVLSVGTFIFASTAPSDQSKIFTLIDNLARTIKITNQPIRIPSSTPTNIPTPTPTPTPMPFMIKSIDPGYIPMNYTALGKNHLTVNGFQFENGAHVAIEGPYDLGSGQIVAGESYRQFQLTNTVFVSSQRLEGIIPDGLPNGYFRIVVTNPDSSSTSTGLSLLRGGDPNEK